MVDGLATSISREEAQGPKAFSWKKWPKISIEGGSSDYVYSGTSHASHLRETEAIPGDQ